MNPTVLFLSCEHAVDSVPPMYHSLFQQEKSVLQTHRAIDFGALAVATHLSHAFACDFVSASVTRLLIDCNRSLHHPHCFSEFSKRLSPEEKQLVIDTYYLPYRQKCERLINGLIQSGNQVLHLSIHSFTPTFEGVTRNAGICFLYDPKRHGEKEVARQWHHLLLPKNPAYRIRMNYPYQGTSDGFTSALRKQHPEKDYLGIEVEMNQALTTKKESLTKLTEILTESLRDLLQLL